MQTSLAFRLLKIASLWLTKGPIPLNCKLCIRTIFPIESELGRHVILQSL